MAIISFSEKNRGVEGHAEVRYVPYLTSQNIIYLFILFYFFKLLLSLTWSLS